MKPKEVRVARRVRQGKFSHRYRDIKVARLSLKIKHVSTIHFNRCKTPVCKHKHHKYVHY